MTKEERAKCDAIAKAFANAFKELSKERINEIVAAMESGPITGGSAYTPIWLYNLLTREEELRA
jgi:hypothetical protein